METLSVRKRRFGFDGIMKGDARSTDLQGIAEETSNSSADDITIKFSSVSHASSISKRRGYRPLSVRIGEAFNPFSSRESKPDSVEPTDKVTESIEGDPQDLWRGLELSKKVNWTENENPHIFNANFVASLTSKRKYTCTPGVIVLSTDLEKAAPDTKDHPVFRADPFSVQTSEPVLQFSLPSDHALVPRTSFDSKSAIPSQTSSRNSQDVDNVVIGLGLIGSKVTPSQTSASPKTVDATSSSWSLRSGADRHFSKSSPPSNWHSEQASSGDGRGSTAKSPAHKNPGTLGTGDLPPSPSFSRFNSRTSSERGPIMAKIFASGSFAEEAVEGKRTRGLSNLFKTKSANKNSAKGERTSKQW